MLLRRLLDQANLCEARGQHGEASDLRVLAADLLRVQEMLARVRDAVNRQDDALLGESRYATATLEERRVG